MVHKGFLWVGLIMDLISKGVPPPQHPQDNAVSMCQVANVTDATHRHHGSLLKQLVIPHYWIGLYHQHC